MSHTAGPGASRAAGGMLAVSLMLGACSAEPTATASPAASLTPTPTPEVTLAPTAPADKSPPPSPIPSPTPFPVGESEGADSLFSRSDTCTNPEIGYTVNFPDDWYTNTEIEGQAACSWFTPDFFEVDVPGQMPEEIWISVGLVQGNVGYNMLTPVESSEDIEIGGYAGHRAEYRVLEDVTDTSSDDLNYQYVVPFDPAGPTLVAATDVDMADDYELAKAVLDRIMASMELDPGVADVPRIPDQPTGAPISGDPVTAEDADASFRLTLAAEQDRYRAGQEIEVVATLTYLGPGDTAVARGSSNPGLIGFSVESEDPPIAINPAYTTDCGAHEMARGVLVEYPFAKSGGYSPDEPLAPFYAAYFNSRELRLPAGTWTISAGGGWYTGSDCGDEPHSLTASITLVVEP